MQRGIPSHPNKGSPHNKYCSPEEFVGPIKIQLNGQCSYCSARKSGFKKINFKL